MVSLSLLSAHAGVRTHQRWDAPIRDPQTHCSLSEASCKPYAQRSRTVGKMNWCLYSDPQSCLQSFVCNLQTRILTRQLHNLIFLKLEDVKSMSNNRWILFDEIPDLKRCVCVISPCFWGVIWTEQSGQYRAWNRKGTKWRNGTAQGLNGFSGVWAAFPGAELPKKLVQLCSLVPSPGWPQRGSTALANDSCFGGWQILLHHEWKVKMEKRGKERIKRFPLFHREPEPIYRIREGINLSWIRGLLIEADMESQAVV